MINKKQETISDIVAEMRQDIADRTVGFWADFGGKIARCYADRIETAAKHAVTDCNHLGNAAKMRDALETISKCDISKEEDCYTLYRVCEAALSSTPRNCDVGTADEQERRWHSNCGSGIPNCKHCKVYEQARKSGLVDDKNMIRFDCRFIWSQMPYEEAKGETK